MKKTDDSVGTYERETSGHVFDAISSTLKETKVSSAHTTGVAAIGAHGTTDKTAMRYVLRVTDDGGEIIVENTKTGSEDNSASEDTKPSKSEPIPTAKETESLLDSTSIPFYRRAWVHSTKHTLLVLRGGYHQDENHLGVTFLEVNVVFPKVERGFIVNLTVLGVKITLGILA